MTKITFAALAALLLASCAGGGGTTPTVVAQATSAPTSGPTSTPTNAPTTGPTIAPTTAPTIAPSLKVIGGAPLSATAAQLSATRRDAQAKTTAQGINNGLPILVESSGMVAIVEGTQVTWVTNAATSQDVPQTSATIAATNGLPINNPGFSQACVGSLAPACVVHPTAWEFGTASTNGKPVGKQTLTIAFGDGTTATTFDYVYDGWTLPCNAGWAYVGGVPFAQALKVNSDVYADCVNGNIDFPKGGFILAQPSQDQFGRATTIMPTLTAQPLFAAANSVVAMSSVGAGMVFAINTQDGGFAKVYFTSGAGVSGSGLNAGDGMSLHSQPNGTFAF